MNDKADVDDCQLPFEFEKELESIDEIPTQDLGVLPANLDIFAQNYLVQCAESSILSIHYLVAEAEILLAPVLGMDEGALGAERRQGQQRCQEVGELHFFSKLIK